MATFTGALLLLANPALASNPPGDNGTVKIHEVELDSNEYDQPHVGCPFTVTFFGFDEGDVATVTFTAWSPTDEGTLLLPPDTVEIGADDNSGGGSTAGFDGEKTYTLDFDGIVPQVQQGFHVQLTVSVTSPESNTPKFHKYKVFWAQPCEEETTTTTTPGETTTTTTPGETTTTTAPGETTTTTTVPGETTTSQGGGGGGVTSQGPTTSPGGGAKGKGALPFTGTSSALPISIAGLAMLALGAASLLTSRARQRRSGGDS